MRHDTAPVSPRRGASLLSILPLVVGSVLAGALLQIAFGGRQTNFDELAVGELGTSIYANHRGHPIHCKGVSDASDCVEGARARRHPAAALWLGNSQVHSVMQLQPDEESAPPQLFRRLEPHGIDLLTFTQPNANLQEHYVLYEYLRQRVPLEILILGVVFDDLRETGLRADIEAAVEDPAVRAQLERSEVGRRLLDDEGQVQIAGGDLAGVSDTFQEHSERWVNEWLEAHVPLWQLRPEARGSLFRELYRLRNTVFGITPQTKRRTIRGRYQANMAAVETLLGSAAEAGIDVLVYVVPLRGDLDIPYDVDEYRSFKRELARRTREHGATFADLDKLVPPEHWGEKSSTSLADQAELDFMHFRATGHALLARALGDLLEESAREDAE